MARRPDHPLGQRERIDDIAFDAVSLSIDDGVRLLERTGGVLTADMARATLSNWWE